jgi:hypothetical protein
MFQWNARLAAVVGVTVSIAAVAGDFCWLFNWLNWSW